MMMIVRNDMPQRRRQDIELCAFSNENGRIELLCIEIKIKNEQWIIISMYKQPKVKTHQLNTCIDKLMNQYINDINVIIIDDTNVNMLKPNLLNDCLDINGLRNVIKEPTCFKCTPSLITSPPHRGRARYCNAHVCLFVCLCVCVCVYPCLSVFSQNFKV